MSHLAKLLAICLIDNYLLANKKLNAYACKMAIDHFAEVLCTLGVIKYVSCPDPIDDMNKPSQRKMIQHSGVHKSKWK